MSSQSFEITLARLYTDPAFRNRFMADPEDTLADCDLTADEQNDMMAIDKAGLLMASRSFLHKRKKRFFNRPKSPRLIAFIVRIANLVRGVR